MMDSLDLIAHSTVINTEDLKKIMFMGKLRSIAVMLADNDILWNVCEHIVLAKIRNHGPDEAPGHTVVGHGCNPDPGCEDIPGRFPGVLFSEDKYFGKKSHLLCILRDTDENLIWRSAWRFLSR